MSTFDNKSYSYFIKKMTFNLLHLEDFSTLKKKRFGDCWNVPIVQKHLSLISN